MFVDLPEAQLRALTSDQLDPDDFDAFWARTLGEARSFPLDVELTPIDTGLTSIDTFDVTFNGFAGQPIKAWLRVPAEASGPLPTIVQYQGYGGGRGHALENLLWASAGFAHFYMDTRGQGSGWSVGATADPDGSGPAYPGVMTRGIESADTYYYRRLFTDAVRAVEAARSIEVVDASRTIVAGASQGGGITLAVAGLVPDLFAAFPRVPFLCDFRRASVITDSHPYKEIGRYLAVHRDRIEQVHGVLAYFDGVNFAKRATAPAWFTTALMDDVCPPSTVFGAFNAYAGASKDIDIWPYNGHEGGQIEDEQRMLQVLRALI
ncbi:prolyl oligopeptidase family serine peptidase [Planctomonas sp. JC2975]|uniref:acetylxylan esterase n=1 Tax=Planctomonas sp. JC2975 TaxID=2729626 RepID=UPI001475D666|nr:acetylxylan esterase [Planctomonas sp. JC2975]NNC12753.1 prolyl oligopeptidase family serine peptidase [Planctomonas sp. JC2975]